MKYWVGGGGGAHAKGTENFLNLYPGNGISSTLRTHFVKTRFSKHCFNDVFCYNHMLSIEKQHFRENIYMIIYICECSCKVV